MGIKSKNMVPEEHGENKLFNVNVHENNQKWLRAINPKIDKIPEILIKPYYDLHNIHLSNSEFIREKIVEEMCDNAINIAQQNNVIRRESNLTSYARDLRNVNRRTSVLQSDIYLDPYDEVRNNYVNNLHRRCVSECKMDDNYNVYDHVTETKNPVLILNENNKLKDMKKKKKLSFNSLFHKKDKHKKDKNEEDHPETYDDFDPHETVPVVPRGKIKKYASALELNQKPSKFHRTPSFIKKLVHIKEDSSSFLKRSLSFRDSSKKKEKDINREKLTEIKNQEWRQSLQSLVETDISVSYKDLSFVDYDAMNDISYDEGSQRSLCPESLDSGYVGRTQSMSERRSPEFRRPTYERVTSAIDHAVSSTSLCETSGALSLPSLHHLNHQENRDHAPETQTATQRYRRRPQSISSSEASSGGSFRSASGGCAKLKRTNACRQKNREDISVEIRRKDDDRTVQRHASSSCGQDHPPSPQAKGESLSRKNSLTHPPPQAKFDLFKREKSAEEKNKKQPLTKQKSIGLESTSPSSSSKCDYFKSLTFKDKSKSASSKNVDTLDAPRGHDSFKGVRKSDKKDSDKTLKPSISFSRSKSSAKPKEGVKQDDFLKATMRIFLVVSPPVGKLQVRSRSLNHLDILETRQGISPANEAALKDSRSEPDCTKNVMAAPPLVEPPQLPTTSSVDAPPVRKHMLSRSQKSSSECFSVNFEVGDENTWDNELFFPAQRGITLFDSLAKLCEIRNIDLSNCDARLLDKETNSEVIIPFARDSANLVGRHVRITGKDASNKKLSSSSYSNHSRKQSGSYRPRTSSFFSSSTEDSAPAASASVSTFSLHDADQNKRQIKQRLTAFFGNTKDNTKYEALIEQLDKFSKQGIPNNLNYPQGQCESVDALYKLEDDWKDIVDYSDLNEKQQQQQTVLWELIKTEVAYIKTLKVVTDLFLACLKDLQSRNLLKEIDTEKLFSNITEILDANVVFWRNTLFPLVRDMRKNKRPSCIEYMLEGFSSIHEIFQPYYKYCAEQSRCQHYCREKNVDSEVFTAYLTWCESQKDCNRLRLMDILVQPMQRLTKYGLLLKAVLKNTEEDVERESLQAMIKMVDDFVNNVNSSLKHRQDKERLKGIIARIESYDIVESKDDDLDKILKKEKAFTQLDLTRPMINCAPERKRHLLLEGDLKLKDNNTSKMEVHCFLLTDMLLICKPSTKKGGATMRVIRQPYLVDKVVVHELHRETPSLAIVYKNEFDMAVAAFILQNNDAKKLKGWKDGIHKAQSLYAQAKQMSYMADESMETDWTLEIESDYDSRLQLIPRSPLATSSRASRVSSLAHSHSGSVEMNDQSSLGSAKDPSRGVSIENDNRTASISSDEGVQPLPSDGKSSVSQKNSFKNRLFNKTPNTLSVQPYGSLGQSLPNLTLGSPGIGTMSLSLNQNTLSVPNSKNASHLLSPTHRGISYPPPSPTRGNLRRSLAISQSKNPPLIKTRQVNSASSISSQQVPTSFDFVPVIAGASSLPDEPCEFSRDHHRQAMKRTYRYHTAGIVDDIKKNNTKDASIHKRLSWNQETRFPNEDQT